MKRNRKRVLLLAYACSPYRGSEEGVGWRRALGAAKYFDTWVLYGRRENKRDINRYLHENSRPPGLHFIYLGDTRLGRSMWRLPKGYYVAHYLWHRRAYRLAERLHKRLRFDVVHQVTWCGFREPGFLWKLDAPFIWGPVGGTHNYPWRFLLGAGIRAAFLEITRNVLNALQLRFHPRVRKAARRAAVLIAANSTVKRDFEEIHKVRPILQLDVGTSGIVKNRHLPREKRAGFLRILWSGRFEYSKALDLLIVALSRIEETVGYELRILGEGPSENAWRNLAGWMGIDSRCTWMGWLPHDKAMLQYDWADVFVFTSLRDTTGSVVLEALSRGVPVICLDHQGTADVVTSACGIKVPVTNPNEVIAGLYDAIVLLARDRQKLALLSHGAVERARRYLWSAKGEEMAKIYQRVIASRPSQQVRVINARSKQRMEAI
jgi:glycosyltransferase involved in cell wall biosynthesis